MWGLRRGKFLKVGKGNVRINTTKKELRKREKGLGVVEREMMSVVGEGKG